ncbi:hypothetical protein HCJ76_44280 [Streptomyces sp. MC1]|uniref:hypothetical protein n=1 Tax=Streptomyces sp. MC1 TaxID=295105 RepID=UPI0018CA7802|nr:hypothetical protein [Streptomyces sp. MC1]MBG7704903.1 hypothetical protein [Streptomyces sp. MC1]
MALSHTSTTLPRRALATLSEKELRKAERTLDRGTWAITFGAVLFSVLTVTPLVMAVTDDRWDWTAPILPLVVDAAVIIVVRLDSTVSRLGGSGGFWPTLLRWMTGVMTLALNVGMSALHRDWVGVAVHSVAPTLLIVTAEAALAYRRAITRALDRIAEAAAAAAEQARAEKEAADERERERLEKERKAREDAEEAQREHERLMEEQRQAAEEKRIREEREHNLRVERERAEREERQRQQERDHLLRLEQERTAREAAERKAKAEQEERARLQREREAAARAAAEQEQNRPTRVSVPVQAAAKSGRRVVVRDVGKDEFAGMAPEEKELALYAIYRQARDESEYENFEDDPRFRQGGDLNGSQLGIRLGRSDAAGRSKVKPKFEAWYREELAKRAEQTAEAEERELVATA